MSATHTRKISASLAGVVAIAASLSIAPAASANDHKSDPDAFFTAINEYQAAHPGDYEGLADVAEDYGGYIQVSTNLTGPTTPANAAKAMKEATKLPGSEGPQLEAMGNFPTDVFAVSITSSGHPASTVVGVTGQVDWRDDFAGQADPLDIASLSFSSQCGTFDDYSAYTWALDGTSTSLASLRDGGAGTGAPTWNVDAYTSGFQNLADRTMVSMTYDKASCGSAPVQAGFIYEGNQGGSVVSVSAGFMGLSVGYSSPGLTLQKGTEAITI